MSPTATLEKKPEETTAKAEAVPGAYDTVLIDGQTVNAKAGQSVDFVVDDGYAFTDDETRVRVVSRTGEKGDPRQFLRFPEGGSPETYVILPAQFVLQNGKVMHGDRYTAVAYSDELRKLILLHNATDNWGSRVIISPAVYRSDGRSAHRHLEIKAVGLVPLEDETVAASS